MTALQPHPRPENPEKGENPQADRGGAGFPPFSPFPGPGGAQNRTPSNPYAAALAAARSYRRTPPPELPKPPRAPRRTKQADALGVKPALPGVPPDCCEGVALLATLPAPHSIIPPRWRMFQATAFRMLHNHGAELHAAGWDAVSVFGLHRAAPATYPPGWGLAWLLNAHGELLDVAPDTIGMRRGLDGARLTFRRGCEAARAGVVPAWDLATGARLDCGLLSPSDRKEADRNG